MQNINVLGAGDFEFAIPNMPTPKGITIDATAVDNEMGTSDEEYSGGAVGVALDGVIIFAAMGGARRRPGRRAVHVRPLRGASGGDGLPLSFQHARSARGARGPRLRELVDAGVGVGRALRDHVRRHAGDGLHRARRQRRRATPTSTRRTGTSTTSPTGLRCTSRCGTTRTCARAHGRTTRSSPRWPTTTRAFAPRWGRHSSGRA